METLIKLISEHLYEISTIAIGLLIRYLEKKLLKKNSNKEKFELEKQIAELQNFIDKKHNN
jgi:hypothetical protein